jgi:hypothetical protein
MWVRHASEVETSGSQLREWRAKRVRKKPGEASLYLKSMSGGLEGLLWPRVAVLSMVHVQLQMNSTGRMVSTDDSTS